jgi:hypothetical protein
MSQTFAIGIGGAPPKETATERLGHIPMNPGVKADQGADKSAHDFCKAGLSRKNRMSRLFEVGPGN